MATITAAPSAPTHILPAAPALGTAARERLLEIARVALRVATGQSPPKGLASYVEQGIEPVTRAAVFVTLTELGLLRGCMGTLDPTQRVEEAVALTAISAAVDDPRFLPVEAAELAALHVDVSVLGTPVELNDPAGFVPGLDGVIVERGGRRALLLPEVATDQGWDGVAMFNHVCQKAGLPADAWRDPRTVRSIFRTTRFGGPAVVAAASRS